MKMRIFLIALCLCVGMSAMAQNRGHRGNRRAQAEQRGPQNIDMVVDTAIINSMQLEPALVNSVLELQAKKQEELKAAIIKMAQQNQGGQDGFNPESIAAMRKQMEDFKAGYRLSLRQLLGTDQYIVYLEKMIDKRPAMGEGRGGAPMGGNQRRMPNGGNWGQGQPGGGWGQGNPGGFDGGNDMNYGGGAGFGDND